MTGCTHELLCQVKWAISFPRGQRWAEHERVREIWPNLLVLPARLRGTTAMNCVPIATFERFQVYCSWGLNILGRAPGAAQRTRRIAQTVTRGRETCNFGFFIAAEDGPRPQCCEVLRCIICLFCRFAPLAAVVKTWERKGEDGEEKILGDEMWEGEGGQERGQEQDERENGDECDGKSGILTLAELHFFVLRSFIKFNKTPTKFNKALSKPSHG